MPLNRLFVTRKNVVTPHRQQAGVVLVVSLIILGLLTLIGLAAVQTTGLEEKIAGNMRVKQQAFQAAESALLAGEKYVQTLSNERMGGVAISCPSKKIKEGLTNDELDFTLTGEASVWLNNDLCDDDTVGSTCSAIKKSPRFVVQCLATGVYRITAYAKGAKPDAVVILQSVYCPEPDVSQCG